MAEIVKIKKDGVIQYPITKPECVIDENGKNVLQLIKENGGGSTPDLSEYLTKEEFNRASEGFATADALEGKQDTIEDLDSIRSGAGKGATAVQPSTLTGYATTQQLTELSAEVSENTELRKYLQYENGSGGVQTIVDITRDSSAIVRMPFAIKAADKFRLSATNLRFPAYGNLNIKTYKGTSVITYIDDFSVKTPGSDSLEIELVASGDAEGFEIVYTYANADQPAHIVITKEVVAESKSKLIEEIKQDINIVAHDVTLKENKKVPFFVETASWMWMRKQAQNFDQDTPFNVQGNIGSNKLQIIGEQKGSILTEADKLSAVVVVAEDGSASCHVLTSFDANALYIYPTLDRNISNGILAPLLNDAQHLTKQGYAAYVQHIFNANPRYCEKNKYIKRFDVGLPDFSQFTPFTEKPVRYEGRRNDYENYMCQYGPQGYFLIPYADYAEGKYGVSWDVETSGKKGYLETFVGTAYLKDKTDVYQFTKESGYEIFIEVYADDVLVFEKIKNTNHIERICVPFERTMNKVRLSVYYKKMRAEKDTLYIGSTTAWLNESNHTHLFRESEVVSQFFDSWGEFHGEEYLEENGILYRQGASGVELHRLLNEMNGIVVPYYNRSKGGMTSRWGKAWWHTLVRSFMPNVMITEFGINDNHTDTATFPDELDPYGNTISMQNAITEEEFYNNMDYILNACIYSNIQPIYIEGCVGQDMEWILTYISKHSKQA